MRVAVIGCGGIAQVHVKSILETEGAELIAVADIVPEKAQKIAKNCGCAAYTDWEEMLKREVLDVVHICTPHYLHTPMICRCLEKGLHVFSEKPPVISRNQLGILSEQVERRKSEQGLRTAVCFQNRWNADVQYAKKLLDSGALGKITGARGFVTWNRDQNYYSDAWHGKKELEGGGALINQGIHTLDLIQYLINQEPVSVSAMMDNFHLKGVTTVEDTLCARIRYPEAAAILYVTTGYVTDSSVLLDIQCEHGRLRMENGELWVYQNGEEGECIRFEQKDGPGKACWGDGHKKAIGHFYESISQGREDLLDFESVKDSIDLMLRIYEAAEM